MRHFYIRILFAIIWLAAGIVSGNVFFLIMSGVFLYYAYKIWKEEKDKKGEE
ncbi:MAG: hypothetical protein Q4F41_14910 [Eubacteriales bacterium]|nr:hypothetical protein [Eubacteriales bacterium]